MLSSFRIFGCTSVTTEAKLVGLYIFKKNKRIDQQLHTCIRQLYTVLCTLSSWNALTAAVMALYRSYVLGPIKNISVHKILDLPALQSRFLNYFVASYTAQQTHFLKHSMHLLKSIACLKKKH